MLYTISIFLHFFLYSELSNTTDVHLSFGRRTGCIGSGVCAIEKPESYHKSTYDALGTIEVARENIILKINKSSISVADAQTQFKDQTFRMEEKLPLSENLTAAIGGDQNRNIPAGTYNVVESKNHYEIMF